MSYESDRLLIHEANLLMQKHSRFVPFKTMGMDGLWYSTGAHLEILAVFSSQPGTGQFRRFIREMQYRHESVSVWEIWNENLFAALVRYGFKPCGLKRDGETLAGLRWDR